MEKPISIDLISTQKPEEPLFSQHEHRILTGQKPYFKRVLSLFSKP